ncbi:MAG TPA: ABC transporter permease, partial [Myxococcota bacterium]
ELTRARLVEFYRDPGALFWVFGMPLLLAIALGLAFRNKPPDPVKVAVVVASEGASARANDVLRADPSFDVRAVTVNAGKLMLRRGQVDVLVDAQSQSSSLSSSLSYRFDDTRPEGRYARLAVERALERAAGRTDVIASIDDKITEPGSRYIDFLLPGLIGMNLLGSSMWGIGYSIVDARKRKLLKRLAATPMKRSHYLLSIMLSRLLFLVAEVVALVVIGRFAFGVSVQGSYAAVGVLALAGGISFTGLSMLIAARTASTEVASGLMNVAMMPMYLLSGSFFSSSRFPDWLQPLIQALPLTALNESLRAVINEAAPLSDQWARLAVMLAWGVIPVIVSLRIFRWQ